jgi:hypothetical protein
MHSCYRFSSLVGVSAHVVEDFGLDCLARFIRSELMFAASTFVIGLI